MGQDLSTPPPRALGLTLGAAFLSLSLAASAFGLRQILLGVQLSLLGLWVSLPSLGIPLAAVISYRLYGLLSARYWLDRDRFALRWGLAREVWPLSAVHSLRLLPREQAYSPPRRNFCWPGCLVGMGQVEGVGPVEVFAGQTAGGLVLLEGPHGALAISPPDPQAFIERYHELARLGSLEPVPFSRRRPDFLTLRIWEDRTGRILLLLGAALCLGFLAFAAARLPSLPETVLFGYHPSGMPQARVPASQLLLLPLVSGAAWLVDLVVGAWLFRRLPQPALAYLVWAVGCAVPLLLWGASLRLLELS